MPRHPLLRNLLFASCFILFLFTLNMVLQKAHERAGSVSTVSIGGTTVAVDVAATKAAREHGLSGRLALAPNTGLLFMFDQDGLWGFWMKDMLFSIDIIWTNAAGRVVTIAPNLSPQTYPQVFYPTAPARYTLEVPAGFAAAHNIQEGSMMNVPDSATQKI